MTRDSSKYLKKRDPGHSFYLNQIGTMIHGVKEMASQPTEILIALRKELQFVEQGGYRTCERFPWRPAFIFQDSPVCPNRGAKGTRVPCTECCLSSFIPAEFRDDEYACRFIPLNASGENLDSLYRCANQEELEAAVKQWLQIVISHLERHVGETHK